MIWSRIWKNGSFPLILVALAGIVAHALTNDRYGFHRDELATLDDARHLAWGYVAYPPLTPFVARVALELFGPSLVGLRLFSGLALGVAVILTGWMAREMGGQRLAQIVAALAVAIAPFTLSQGTVFQYVSLDYLWWVLAAYLTVRLLRSGDPRWWLGIGAAIGLGMLSENFREEIGWPELVQSVRQSGTRCRPGTRADSGSWQAIMANPAPSTLYGPGYHSPPAISGVNTAWLRGFGAPPTLSPANWRGTCPIRTV